MSLKFSNCECDLFLERDTDIQREKKVRDTCN